MTKKLAKDGLLLTAKLQLANETILCKSNEYPIAPIGTLILSPTSQNWPQIPRQCQTLTCNIELPKVPLLQVGISVDVDIVVVDENDDVDNDVDGDVDDDDDVDYDDDVCGT